MAKAPAASFRADPLTLEHDTVENELRFAGDYPELAAKGTTAEKKNFAEALSRALAQRFADLLRPQFPGILPDQDGRGQESRARTGKGLKKLDVNYSTVQLGLGLGVSVKTINFRDGKTRRYTKKFTRADNEFRAEAADYHERQPYAVLCGVFFLPADACDDVGRDPSSFGQAVRTFRFRTGRASPKDDPTLFERFLIGIYDTRQDRFGQVGFFDVEQSPPRSGRPPTLMGLGETVRRIVDTYDARNRTTFTWADASSELSFVESIQDESLDE